MSNISLSKKELDLLNYKLAFIRSRKFNIQERNIQNFIRTTFSDAILLDSTDRSLRIISTIQRSLFPVENEDKSTEMISPKNNDFFLLSLFFDAFCEHIENGLSFNFKDKPLHVSNSPIEILLKGFCSSISKDICSSLFYRKNNLNNKEQFILSLNNSLKKIKESFPEQKHKKWINVCGKSLMSFLEKEKNKLITTEAPSNMHSSTTQVTIAEESKKIKPLSKWTSDEISLTVAAIHNNKHTLNEKELADFVSFIVRNADRVTRFLKKEEVANTFYQLAFSLNLNFVLPKSFKLSIETKTALSNFLSDKKPKFSSDVFLLSEQFLSKKIDKQPLIEMFLRSYKDNSQSYVEELFLKEKNRIDDLSYPNQNYNFLFFDKSCSNDLDILHFFIVHNHNNGTTLRYEKEEFTIEDEKFNFESFHYKANTFVPIIASSWNFYKLLLLNLYSWTLECYPYLSDDEQILANSFLSTLEFVNIENSSDFGLLHYKLMNFGLSKEEIYTFINKSYQNGDNSKVFLNKKTSEKLLFELVKIYSSLSNQYKFNLFSKIEDAIVLEWLQTLDPLLLEVSSLINVPIADSLSIILNNLSEIKHHASFGHRSSISY